MKQHIVVLLAPEEVIAAVVEYCKNNLGTVPEKAKVESAEFLIDLDAPYKVTEVKICFIT